MIFTLTIINKRPNLKILRLIEHNLNHFLELCSWRLKKKLWKWSKLNESTFDNYLKIKNVIGQKVSSSKVLRQCDIFYAQSKVLSIFRKFRSREIRRFIDFLWKALTGSSTYSKLSDHSKLTDPFFPMPLTCFLEETSFDPCYPIRAVRGHRAPVFMRAFL